MFIYRIFFIDIGNKEYFVFNYFILGKKKRKKKENKLKNFRIYLLYIYVFWFDLIM